MFEGWYPEVGFGAINQWWGTWPGNLQVFGKLDRETSSWRIQRLSVRLNIQA